MKQLKVQGAWKNEQVVFTLAGNHLRADLKWETKDGEQHEEELFVIQPEDALKLGTFLHTHFAGEGLDETDPHCNSLDEMFGKLNKHVGKVVRQAEGDRLRKKDQAEVFQEQHRGLGRYFKDEPPVE